MSEPKTQAIGPIFDDEDGLPPQQRATGGGDEDLTPLNEKPKSGRRAMRRERTDDDPRSSRRAGKRGGDDPRATHDDNTGTLITPMNFDILPEPPKIDGWHLCWLSTTNVQDSIQNRMRMGYELVTADEVGPDFEFGKVKEGQFANGVQIREMVLFKIPQDIYEAYMMHVHHNEPIGTEQAIRQDVGAMEDQLTEYGSNVMVGAAIRELGKVPKKPTFET